MTRMFVGMCVPDLPYDRQGKWGGRANGGPAIIAGAF
jgi:hypothetical protein